MNNGKSKQKRQGNGQSHYKLVFKPAEYTGRLANWNNDYENGPLLTWHNTGRKRCYMLVKKYKMTWAAIYDEHNPAETLDEYTQQDGWRSGEG